MPKPVAVFFAGCNGSGKSTLRDEILKSNYPFIDADLIAKQVNFSHLPNADIAAGREAIRRFRLFIEQKQSFSIETTLSGIGALNNMRKAKNAGFEVHLYYCALANVELNIARVAERVAKGGHHIPENTIRRRYDESLHNLKTALEIADKSIIFDNSFPKKKYQECVMMDKTSVYVSHLPDYLKPYLPQQIVQNHQFTQSKHQYETALSMLPENEQHAMRENEKVARAMFAFIENPQDKLNAMLKFYQTNTEHMNRDIKQSPQNIDDVPEIDR